MRQKAREDERQQQHRRNIDRWSECLGKATLSAIQQHLQYVNNTIMAVFCVGWPPSPLRYYLMVHFQFHVLFSIIFILQRPGKKTYKRDAING